MQEFTECESTCIDKGCLRHYYCMSCGRYYSDINGEKEMELNSWILPLTDHKWSGWTTTKEATCSEVGSKEKVCVNCGNKVTEEIPATGHKEVIDQAEAATCTKTGKTEGSHCSVCGEVIKAQETILELGHSWNQIYTVDRVEIVGIEDNGLA